MAEQSVEAYRALKSRIEKARQAGEKSRRDLAVAEADLKRAKEDAEREFGHGSATVANLTSIAEKKEKEAAALEREVEATLAEHGF